MVNSELLNNRSKQYIQNKLDDQTDNLYFVLKFIHETIVCFLNTLSAMCISENTHGVGPMRHVYISEYTIAGKYFDVCILW